MKFNPKTHTAVSISALESMGKMVQRLQDDRDELLACAKLAGDALNVSRPIDDKSVIPHNKHVHALNCVERVIARCTDSTKVTE